MGYDLRIYVLESISSYHRKGLGTYAERIATVEMCVVDQEIHAFLNEHAEPSKFYFFGDDGNKPFSIRARDAYGAKLMTIQGSSVPKFLALVKKMNESETYRRYDILIGFLEAMKLERWPNAVLAFYGH